MGKHNWPIIRLGEVTTIETGQKDVNAGDPEGEYPFFTCSRKTYRINTYTHDAEAVLVAGNGDFSVKYYTGKFDVYQRTYVLKKKNNQVDLKFIFELLKNGLAKLTANNQGSTIKYLKMGDFVNFKIPLPGIETQHKIATILASVDDAASTTQKVIDQTERLKKGLMRQLFTCGIGHTKFKQTEIGRIPDNWDLVTMRDICTVRQGLQIPISQRFNEPGKDRFEYLTIRYLSDKNNQASEYIEAPNGSVICAKDDLLMARTGKTGEVITNVEGVFHNNFFLMDYNRLEINRWFMYYFLKSDRIQNILKLRAGTTTIPDLNHGDFYSIFFVRPNLDEQRQIANIFLTVDKKLEVNKKLVVKKAQLKSGLMQDLLAGRVAVC